MTTPADRTLVLFDVDGTLVLTGRAGVRGMNAAFARLHGRHDALAAVAIAGRTDRAIVADVFDAIGVAPTEEAIAALRDAYLEHLREALDLPVEHPKGVLPGVADLLAALESRPDVDVGLLTGNFEGGAAIKLGHFDLWRRFRFGAFGDRHVDRRDLLPVAVDRARAAGRAPARPGRVVVVGDTPLDVDCARAHGARALAVATGPFDQEALARSGADLAVDTLEDVERLATWIVG